MKYIHKLYSIWIFAFILFFSIFNQIWFSPLPLVPPRVDQGKTKFDKHISIILWRSIRYIDWVGDPSTFGHFSNCQAGIVRRLRAAFLQQSTMSNVFSSALRDSDINNLQVVIKYDDLHSRSGFTETFSLSVLIRCPIITNSRLWQSHSDLFSGSVSFDPPPPGLTQSPCHNVLEKLINYPRSCWSML